MASDPDRSAADAAQVLAGALDAQGMDYAIGGALALAVAGVPRGTADVDLNVFVEMDRVSDVVAALESAGVEFNALDVKARVTRDGMFVGRLDGMRIDVFLPSIAFAEEAKKTRIRVSDASGWSGWFLSAEALSVFKLLFFRGKDLVDLERLVAVRPELDVDYVRHHIADMMGDDDARVKRWNDIVSSFRA